MKNSGTFRSEKGADAFLDLLSIVETTKKHNYSCPHCPIPLVLGLFCSKAMRCVQLYNATVQCNCTKRTLIFLKREGAARRDDGVLFASLQIF